MFLPMIEKRRVTISFDKIVLIQKRKARESSDLVSLLQDAALKNLVQHFLYRKYVVFFADFRITFASLNFGAFSRSG